METELVKKLQPKYPTISYTKKLYEGNKKILVTQTLHPKMLKKSKKFFACSRLQTSLCSGNHCKATLWQYFKCCEGDFVNGGFNNGNDDDNNDGDVEIEDNDNDNNDDDGDSGDDEDNFVDGVTVNGDVSNIKHLTGETQYFLKHKTIQVGEEIIFTFCIATSEQNAKFYMKQQFYEHYT